jgi:hypothetical protein
MLLDNLLFCYGIMIASEPLIEEALKHQLIPELEQYYQNHLVEEHNHADWLLEDLKSAGVTPPLVDWRAALIAGTQYYLIKHISPDALLGYMAALECNPPSLQAVERLEELHGKQLIRTVRYHAEHDIKHGPELLSFIENTPGLNLDLINNNRKQTAMLLSNVYDSIVKKWTENA